MMSAFSARPYRDVSKLVVAYGRKMLQAGRQPPAKGSDVYADRYKAGRCRLTPWDFTADSPTLAFSL